jgi:hypothetical protein
VKPKAIESPQTEKDKRTAQINALIPKARTDAKAAAQFWELLEADGAQDHFLRSSDIAWQTERSLTELYTGKDDVLSEQMAERRLKLMRRELAGDNPTPLEKLLAQRIALCWFHVNLCELSLAQKGREYSIAQATYHQKRLDSAHKRYLGAIKALAQVRKLQLPAIQMNIGEKQVNIGTMNGAPNGKLSD